MTGKQIMRIKYTARILIALILWLCYGCINTFAEKGLYEEEIEQVLQTMTLEEKVAQLFVVLPEQLVDTDVATGAYEATKEAIVAVPVGGLIYMSSNLQSAEQIQKMLGNVQQYSMERTGMPAFLCVDEEGGSVSRINGRGIVDAPYIPDMSKIGQRGDPEEAYQVGDTIGAYLEYLGFNVDFAPVADVLSNEGNQVVRYRSFGGDPQLVSVMALSLVEGIQNHSVYATLKHFPGHGGTQEDSHSGQAYLYGTLEELQNCELVPFRDGIAEGIDFIMVGHMILPEVQEEQVPSSLSEEIITGLLREEMGYQGIVITDAMNMGAIYSCYSSADAARKAILAGADLILMPADFYSAYYGLLQDVRGQVISEERIDASLRRIFRVKMKLREKM